MKTRLNVRELVLVSAPIVLLFVGAKWLQVRSQRPAPLVISSTIMTYIGAKRAIAEVYTPPGQPILPGTTTVASSAPRYQRRLDRKIKVVLNCNGQRPAWWGGDDLGSGAFLKSTASQLAWNVNADLSFIVKGKEVTYRESDRTIGVMGGTPYYDAALDRYVACFYFASTCVPSPNSWVKFEADFWPNATSPPAKAAVRLNLK